MSNLCLARQRSFYHLLVILLIRNQQLAVLMEYIFIFSKRTVV